MTAGPDEGRTFDIDNGLTVIIGRGQKSDTHLNDSTVSRIHCELHVAENEPELLDNDSVSGTFVNGLRIKRQVLNPEFATPRPSSPPRNPSAISRPRATG